MPRKTSRLVYVYRDGQTVTIDYNQTLKLFVTTKEQLSFSPERLLCMLNKWAKLHQVDALTTGCVHIGVANAHCILTCRAAHILFASYQNRQDWQQDFPFVSRFLARYTSVVLPT
jgi:hypothetical protein